MLILDVGAGMWRDYNTILRKNPHLKIFAFEPHPKLYEKLECDNTNRCDRLHLYNIAVSDRSIDRNKFYLINDPVASSLLPINKEGAKQWKYPILRPSFNTVGTIDVKSTTIKDFIQKIKSKNGYTKIDLLNIDVQGASLKVLQGITSELFKCIERIIVKCIDPEIQLYDGQSDLVKIFDVLEINGFGLIRGARYSREQEHVLEFVNLEISKHRAPWFYIDKTGQIRFEI